MTARSRFTGLLKHRSMRAVERALLAVPYQPVRPQLFVLGLPRSGTTLVYQYLAHRLRLAYFTNGVGTRPAAAAAVTLYESLRYPPYRSDFVSSYGRVAGARAPREAGAFWNRFFDRDHPTGPMDLPYSSAIALFRTVACVQFHLGQRPFINKNVKHMLRLPALLNVFPESRFLVVHRDLRQVALSLFRGRMARSNPAEWWSVLPPECPWLLDLPLEEQIAHQAYLLHGWMERQLQALPASRVFHLDYEIFCSEPEEAARMATLAVGPVEAVNPASTQFTAAVNHPQGDREGRVLQTLEHLGHHPPPVPWLGRPSSHHRV